MSKRWNVLILVVCLALLTVLTVGATVLDWPEKLNASITVTNPTIGTSVGPGEGHIPFPIGNGISHVEAIAKLPMMPAIGDALTVEVTPDMKVTGQVVSINCTDCSNVKRGIVTILTLNYGLVTTGVTNQWPW